MRNQYYRVIQFIRDNLSQDPNVNTITFGELNEADIDKKNIYGLVHIVPGPSTLANGQVFFTFTIVSLDQRNESKEPTTDKFVGNDNFIDNLNTTFAVLLQFLTNIRLTNNDQDIELIGQPTPSPLIFGFTNSLDGWEVDIVLATTNDIETC